MPSLVAGQGVRVRVPASSANLGPGFDSIGLALGIWDECDVVVGSRPGLRIHVEGEAHAEVPRDEAHLVYRAMLRAWQELDATPVTSLELTCRNAVPHGRGLGSSATAIVAGVVAAQGIHALWHRPGAVVDDFDRDLATTVASAIEGHPDNASASVHGGMTIAWADDADPGRIRCAQIRVSPAVIPLVLVPTTRLPTETARALLPDRVPHRQAALGAGRAALLVEAMGRRPDLLLPATRDWLHQEARRECFPESMALVDRLRGDGHAATISGAGPSVLVLSTTDQVRGARSAVDPAVWQMLMPGVPPRGARMEALRPPVHMEEVRGVTLKTAHGDPRI